MVLGFREMQNEWHICQDVELRFVAVWWTCLVVWVCDVWLYLPCAFDRFASIWPLRLKYYGLRLFLFVFVCLCLLLLVWGHVAVLVALCFVLCLL